MHRFSHRSRRHARTAQTGRRHGPSSLAALIESALRACRIAGIAAILLATWLAQGHSHAEAASQSTQNPSSACTDGARQALTAIACELLERLGGANGSTLVVAGPVDGLDGDAARNELSLRLAQVVAATLGKGASAAPRTAASSQAQSMAASCGRLVYLAPKVSGARFEVVAEVSEVPRNFWVRTRGAKPSPIRHAFVQQPLDAELRSFLPRPPLVVTKVDKAKHAIQAPVAIACGDISGDQGLEVLVVGRHELGLGRLRHGRFVPRALARWSDLSPITPAPSRQVMASAWIESGQAWVGTSDRAHAVVLGADLRLRQSLEHLLPWAPSQCAVVSSTAIVPTPVPCETTLAASAPSFEAEGVHAVAGAQISTVHDPPIMARATFDADTDQVVLRDGSNREVSLSGVGAQIAVGDVDGDGQAELLTSRATLEPAKDALDVHTWADNGRLVRRFSVPTPRGIAALAVCPAEDLGLAPIVVATSDELWVVR